MKIGFEGYTSAEIAILSRVADLARRFGLRPSDADASFSIFDRTGFEHGVYELNFDNRPDAPGTEKGDKFDKMMDALGFDYSGGIRAEHLDVIEDIVERAISRAPRARTVG